MHDGALRIVDLVSGHDSVIAEPAGQEMVTFGLAEFVAAEEMGRSRGYWWSPDGSQLLIARVDESPVKRWYIADPANPDQAPTEVGYPAAGTANADVSLLLATIAKDAVDGTTAKLEEVDWDRAAFPYLAAVAWSEAPLMVVQSRDQKVMRLINAATGELLREDADPDWTDVIDGVPAQLANGDIVWTGISDDTRGLIVAPAAGLQDATPAHPARPAGPRRSRHRRQRRAVRGRDRADRDRRLALRPGRAGRACDRARRQLGHRRGRRDRARPARPGQQRPVGHGPQARRRARAAAPDRVARAGPEPAPPAAEVPAGGPGRHPHGGAVPVLAPGRAPGCRC